MILDYSNGYLRCFDTKNNQVIEIPQTQNRGEMMEIVVKFLSKINLFIDRNGISWDFGFGYGRKIIDYDRHLYTTKQWINQCMKINNWLEIKNFGYSLYLCSDGGLMKCGRYEDTQTMIMLLLLLKDKEIRMED